MFRRRYLRVFLLVMRFFVSNTKIWIIKKKPFPFCSFSTSLVNKSSRDGWIFSSRINITICDGSLVKKWKVRCVKSMFNAASNVEQRPCFCSYRAAAPIWIYSTGRRPSAWQHVPGNSAISQITRASQKITVMWS